MANGVFFNTSGSVALGIDYVAQGPYSGQFIDRQGAKTLRINAEVFLRVDRAILIVDEDVDIDEGDLDTGVAYGATTTYYIYACQPLDGSGVPVFKISENATFPDGGWDADNSRQIGGFITDGAGDIAAAGNNLWDLLSQATTGMVAKSLFNANTIIAADTDDTPAPVTINEEAFVGRRTSGTIASTTMSVARDMLALAANAANGTEIIAYP